jgi:fatty acid desaturase
MRDYSLTGPDGRRAVETGLADATWFRPSVDRATMKALMQRRDGPAVRDTLVWLALLAASGAAVVVSWPSWWVLPALVVYGVLYGSASDSRWHECGHGTAFRTRWMNTVVYELACFLIMRDPTVWRWSHARHHTDTYVVGRDPEILFVRPTSRRRLVAHLFGVIDVPLAMRHLVLHARGRLTADERTYVPESARRRTYRTARLWLVVYLGVAAACVAMRSVLPVVLVGAPRAYGCWHMVLCGITQHGGLAQDVLDHRLNTRSMRMNPLSRFVYWNMNHHVEHHLFPLVPYHALPALQAAIAPQLPLPSSGFVAALREVGTSLRRQRSEPDYALPRTLPDGTPLVPAARVAERA